MMGIRAERKSGVVAGDWTGARQSRASTAASASSSSLAQSLMPELVSEDGRPHKYAAKTAEGRRRQLANMQQPGRPSHGLTHGATSRHALEPLRQEALAWTHERWPDLDAPRRQLVASLAARVRRVELWAAEHDILLRRKTGVAAHPVVGDWDRWEARLEQLITRLDVEQRERDAGVTDATVIERELVRARDAAANLGWGEDQ